MFNWHNLVSFDNYTQCRSSGCYPISLLFVCVSFVCTGTTIIATSLGYFFFHDFVVHRCLWIRVDDDRKDDILYLMTLLTVKRIQTNNHEIGTEIYCEFQYSARPQTSRVHKNQVFFPLKYLPAIFGSTFLTLGWSPFQTNQNDTELLWCST